MVVDGSRVMKFVVLHGAGGKDTRVCHNSVFSLLLWTLTGYYGEMTSFGHSAYKILESQTSQNDEFLNIS